MPDNHPIDGTVVTSFSAGHFIQDHSYRTFREGGSSSWLAILTLGGQGRVGFRGGEFKSEAQNFCLFQPFNYQLYETDREVGRWEFLWCHFHPRPHWDSLMKWPTLGPGVSSQQLDSVTFMKVTERLAAINRLSLRPRRVDELLAINAIEECLIRCWDLLEVKGGQTDARILRSIEIMEDQFHLPLTMSELASQVNLSSSRFGHLFQSQMGEGPRAYLERLRLTRARQALEMTDRPINLIAEDVGFENSFYFSNRFRQKFRMSPTVYRNSLRPHLK